MRIEQHVHPAVDHADAAHSLGEAHGPLVAAADLAERQEQRARELIKFSNDVRVWLRRDRSLVDSLAKVADPFELFRLLVVRSGQAGARRRRSGLGGSGGRGGHGRPRRQAVDGRFARADREARGEHQECAHHRLHLSSSAWKTFRLRANSSRVISP